MKLKKKFKIIEGGITAPKGFLANGVNCGLRKNKLDLAVIYSEKPCTAAGTFTKNIVKAAPVIFTQENINNPIYALVVNSKIANACTGKKGYDDTVTTSKILGNLLDIASSNVLIFSTGIIGKFLDMQKIQKGLYSVSKILSKEGGKNVAKAILTTDTVKKEIAVECTVLGKKVKIAGIAKGSGMIAPDMATLLAFITSDICIEKKLLKKIFNEIVNKTFNTITIDGEMSTNDSAVIVCNSLAGNKMLTEKDKKDVKVFYDNLFFVMKDLSKKLVKDGEGATKLIEINVVNAKSRNEAKTIGFKIGNSPLVKTAIYGADANWGRILATVGAKGIKFNPNKIEIKFGPYTLFKNGSPAKFSEKRLKSYLHNHEIKIIFNLNQGKNKYTVFSSDFTEEYIKINAHYRS